MAVAMAFWIHCNTNSVLWEKACGLKEKKGQPFLASYSFLRKLLKKGGDGLVKNRHLRGAWVAQSVKPPTSAQVVISWFVSLSPTSGWPLSVQSLLQILSPSPPPLSAPSPFLLSLKNK